MISEENAPLPRIHLLAESNDSLALRDYVSQHGYSSELIDPLGMTALARAVFRKRLNNVEFLCSLDTSYLDVRFWASQQTMLHLSCSRLAICETLLKHGANKTIRNYVSAVIWSLL